MGFKFDHTLISFAKNQQDDNQHDYDGYAVTPADATQLANGRTRGLYVTGTGNIAGTMADGTTTVLLTGVPANTFVPISLTIVASTSTTATDIYALY